MVYSAWLGIKFGTEHREARLSHFSKGVLRGAFYDLHQLRQRILGEVRDEL